MLHEAKTNVELSNLHEPIPTLELYMLSKAVTNVEHSNLHEDVTNL